MAVKPLLEKVLIEEYLASSYQPNCDFVDGHIEERNLGEYDHARIQALLAIWFGTHEADWEIEVTTEQRVQVSKSRFRV